MALTSCVSVSMSVRPQLQACLMTLADHKTGAIVNVVCRIVQHAVEKANSVSAVTLTACQLRYITEEHGCWLVNVSGTRLMPTEYIG